MCMLKSTQEMQPKKATCVAVCYAGSSRQHLVLTPIHVLSEEFLDQPISKELDFLVCFTFLQVLATFNLLYLVHLQCCIILFLRKWHRMLFLRCVFVCSCCIELNLTQDILSKHLSTESIFLENYFLKVN